jgi:hypothetical protein
MPCAFIRPFAAGRVDRRSVLDIHNTHRSPVKPGRPTAAPLTRQKPNAIPVCPHSVLNVAADLLVAEQPLAPVNQKLACFA